MYLSFYGLAEKPFSITPDPRYLYLGARHAEALAHLVYGITEAGGFIQLTGEVGTGKTTVVRSLLAKLPANTEVALVLNPRMNSNEFVATLCSELGIFLPDSALASERDLIDILNTYLLKAHAQGHRVVLIVDEAQNLTPELLEQVRLLTNLETETQKLLQIILIGQPELRDLLARNDLRQLAQRITGRYHLDPLSREDSVAYIRHRMRIAGATVEVFTSGALNELYRVSGGVPRLLNIIGDRALLGGYSEDRHLITAAVIRKAAGEVFGRRITPVWLPWALGSGTAVAVAGAALIAWSLRDVQPAKAATVVAAPVVAPAAATALVATPPVRGPDLAKVLSGAATVTDMDAAYARLFSLWSARFEPGSEDACAQASRQGLQCLDLQGGIDNLRRFNRPAILPLEDRSGSIHQVVVSALRPDKVRLLVGDATHEVTLPELQELWTGDFLIFWKPALPGGGNLSLGAEGEPVQALRQRLHQWAGLPADAAASAVFDESLLTLVMQFQRRHGIAADGVVGTQTQALLDAALSSGNSPLLAAVDH